MLGNKDSLKIIDYINSIITDAYSRSDNHIRVTLHECFIRHEIKMIELINQIKKSGHMVDYINDWEDEFIITIRLAL